MQKIVIDTNVIVSSLIQRSYPFKIVYELLLDNKFDICVSEELMSEYFEFKETTKMIFLLTKRYNKTIARSVWECVLLKRRE